MPTCEDVPGKCLFLCKWYKDWFQSLSCHFLWSRIKLTVCVWNGRTLSFISCKFSNLCSEPWKNKNVDCNLLNCKLDVFDANWTYKHRCESYILLSTSLTVGLHLLDSATKYTGRDCTVKALSSACMCIRVIKKTQGLRSPDRLFPESGSALQSLQWDSPGYWEKPISCLINYLK